MAIEKQMGSRVLLKNDIEANWMKAVNFIPKLGEAIIYNAELDGQEPIIDGIAIRQPIKYPRVKIGDGITNVNDLPFMASDSVDFFVQNEEPENAPENTVWIDLDEDSGNEIIQSDWDITDEADPAYIKNKPEIITKEYVDEAISNASIEVDSTLSQEGKAADAKAVGDALTLKADKTDLIQSDWEQTDETATNYIKNKPVLATSEEVKALFN